MSLKLKTFNGWETLVCKERSVSPFFSSQIRFRINHKLFTNIAVTGEPGIGKSYAAVDMARICEGLTRDGKDRFDVDQIVYRQSEYMDLVGGFNKSGTPKLAMGKAIVFDEPSYALGKRDWFMELQKVLVHTLESQRFLIHPLWIPIINLALLDKTIRSYLISHVVHMIGRGHGRVYRVKPSQRQEKVYWYMTGELYYRMLDKKLCSKDSCLGCKLIDPRVTPPEQFCQIFRARYEVKKRGIQIERYAQGKEQSLQRESKDLTDQQIEQILDPNLKDMLNEKGKLSTAKMRMFLRGKGVIISTWKAYQIKGNMESAHPEKFEES